MIKVKRIPGVLYLDRSKALFYSDTKTKPQSVDFREDFIKDLEIKNTQGVLTQLKSFIETAKVGPMNLNLVLAPSMYFEKDLTANLSDESQEEEAQKFLSAIPFDEVAGRVYKLKSGQKIVATNKTLIYTLKSIFESLGFSVNSVLPIFVLGSSFTEKGFDIKAAEYVLRKRDTLREWSITVNNNSEKINESTGTQSVSKNKRLIFLIFIFCASLVSLLALLLMTVR
ncbi:hypothetical protein HY008_02085 [Candidatus Woesebacteria bacterium]|nr:hypothetical protein [Candidatus Woesebacteria bacterium]